MNYIRDFGNNIERWKRAFSSASTIFAELLRFIK
jgi:hypothetical protein